jgi:hypothetical protein
MPPAVPYINIRQLIRSNKAPVNTITKTTFQRQNILPGAERIVIKTTATDQNKMAAFG